MAGTHELWKALLDQAEVWQRTPVFSGFAEPLPRNAGTRSSMLSKYLHELKVKGASIVGNPLRLGGIIPWIRDSNVRFPGEVPEPREFQAWLGQAARVEKAHRNSVAWYRSRLPAYPMILAPQLTSGTPLTTVEWTSRLSWAPDERRQALQLEPRPRNASRVLGAEGAVSIDLEEAARAVSSAMVQTPEWRLFADAVSGLDQIGREDLRIARARLKALLAPHAVDAHEPQLALPRANYRDQMLSDIIDTLTGAARTYTEAFGAVNDLIDFSTSEIFGQMAAYGHPMSLDIAKLDFHGGAPARVAFEIGGDHLFDFDCGNLLCINDDLVEDIVQVESISISVDPVEGEQGKVQAVIVENTSRIY